MRNIISGTILFLINYGLHAGQDSKDTSYFFTITIEALQLKNDRGQVIVQLFNDKNKFLKDKKGFFKNTTGVITKQHCRIAMDKVPKGTYAVVIFHDENKNNELDCNVLGIPKEGFGVSRNAKMLFGPPKFKDANIIVESDTTLEINLRY